MSQLGMTAMIAMLSGNEGSAETFRAALGKTIVALKLDDNTLCFTFDDGSTLKLSDTGQNCCESRYMSTDDDLAYFVGAKLLGAEVKDAPSIEDEHLEQHDVQFLSVETSKGVFTMQNHNEHNGYYGGFVIEAHT